MEMIELAEIARLEELRQARGMSEIADGFAPLGSGVMCRGEAGTWLNMAVGVGLAEPAPEGAVDALIEWFEPRGVEARIEVSPYTDAALLRGLAARGFTLTGFEHVYFRVPGGEAGLRAMVPPPAGLEIREVDPGDERAVRVYGEVVAGAFAPEGHTVTEAEIDVTMRCVRHARTRGYAAYIDGRCVGGGAMEIAGAVAALFGLAVAADYRRKGIQQALIAHRFNVAAAAAGVRVVTISSRPGVATERNV